jgi:hypothetical protein
MKRDLYAEVSTRIVAELEAGAAPWVKPWSATAGMNTPCNAATNRPYSGCNILLLWMAQTAGYSTSSAVICGSIATVISGNDISGRERESNCETRSSCANIQLNPALAREFPPDQPLSIKFQISN